jgi:integrase
MRTTFPNEIDGFGTGDTVLTQNSAVFQPEPERDVRFPKRIKHRDEVAVIYGKTKARPYYRVAWKAAGRRQMKSFPKYGEAKAHAEAMVRELAKGLTVTALTPGQARDALAAFERLQSHYQTTGRRVSLLAAVSQFAEADAKLGGRTMGEAVEGFLTSIAAVRRKDIGEAVEEFITGEEPKTKSQDGQRAQLSAAYAFNRAIQLRRFAATFPGHAVCDLTKAHLDKFIGSLGKIQTKSRNHRNIGSSKTRNGYRAAVRQFLQWSVRKDYLSATHRLLEADTMRPEQTNGGEITFYTPRELSALLAGADDSLRPLIAIGALAGLRTAEILRLTWEDVWRVEGHIEISSGKSKTRQRRLVEVVPALAAWLEPFRASTGQLWTGHEVTFQQHFGELCETAKLTRKANGLRHAFCTYHFALHANESLTAQQAGNSPTMIHAHYKGLATKAESGKWFNVLPPRPASVVQMAT